MSSIVGVLAATCVAILKCPLSERIGRPLEG
jgi:hypothetical protein